MTLEEYLETLRRKLRGFPRADQAALIEEISSHIECGENDLSLGSDLAQRREKLMSELDSPDKMVKGLKSIYQPDGLIDYLLVAIPLLLNTSLNLLLVSLMPRYPWADVRIVLLFHLLLIAVGVARRSKLLTLFWIPRTAIQVAAMLALTQGYFLHQIGIWLLVLLGLVYLFGKIVWQNRRDILVVTYALLPVVIGGFGIAVGFFPEVQFGGGAVDLSILQAFSRFSIFLDLLNLAALAVLFLAGNRDLRWSALAVYGLLLGSWVTQPRDIFLAWIILPLLAVFLGWFLEKSTNPKKSFAT
jgi:hypothetical protein